MTCCGGNGGCGTTFKSPTTKEEVEKMTDTVKLMKASNLFGNSEIALIEKAIESHWMYEELK